MGEVESVYRSGVWYNNCRIIEWGTVVIAVHFQEGDDETIGCFLDVLHDGTGLWRV